jgi:dTMP kinase
MKYGRFISIEGGDGAGKSTQLEVIADTLQQSDIEVVMTREPGGTPVGEQLRALLLEQGEHSIADETELLLMFAARAEHVNTLIKPALEQGKWVVSDRFSDASFAYQGASGVSLERIQALSDWVLQGFAPNLTLLFNLSIEQGLERVDRRGAQDRFEQESLAYKRQVQDIYLQRAAAEPERIKLIDASRKITDVSAQVQEKVQAFIQGEAV